VFEAESLSFQLNGDPLGCIPVWGATRHDYQTWLNNHSLRGLLTEAFVCSSKALHRDPNDLWCHLIPARHDTAINSAVNCRCRQRVRRAYFHNLKLRVAMFVNVSFRLGFLAVS
jgi:hypothetical protein